MHALSAHVHVSIHAAREGGDNGAFQHPQTAQGFNPRRPRGRRHAKGAYAKQQITFQSTPPARAATSGSSPTPYAGLFQSTPPARAATCAKGTSLHDPPVSIHAAREGGDLTRVYSR